MLCSRFGFEGVAMGICSQRDSRCGLAGPGTEQAGKVDLLRSLVFPLAISGAAATAVWLAKGGSQASWLTLCGWILAGLVFYVLLLLLVEGRSLLGDIRVFLTTLARRERKFT